MEKLRILNKLKNIEEFDDVALKGRLVCDCGCDKFYIYHTGKQTKGILSPDIVNINKKIIILAKCTVCGDEITIFDTSIDGIDTTKEVAGELKQFKIKNTIDKFKIILYYNYFKQNFKSNYFLDIFIDVENDFFKKNKRIYEG